MTGWVVRNQTPVRLRLVGDAAVLELAPLQAKRISTSPLDLGAAESEAVAEGALAWDTEPVREVRERWAALVLALAGVAAVWGGTALWSRAWGRATAAVVVLLLCAGLLTALDRLARVEQRGWRLRRRGDGDQEADFRCWQFARGVVQRVLHLLLLVLVLAVGLAVPAAAVWYGTGLPVVLDDLRGASDSAAVANELVARGLQVVLIALLVLMPALMYFWFDREQVETLLDRWLHHIFRFDPTLRTLVDVDAKYGRRLEEAYGTIASGVGLRSQQRARSRAPVVTATLLVALGWVLVLVNIGSGMGALAGGETSAAARTSALFMVATTPISFAFLGAYVYALQVVFRGYVRGDLRPKTYNAISVRIIVAFVLAGVLQGVLPDDGTGGRTALVAAFLAGIVPDTVLRRVRDLAGWKVRSGERDELADEWPLTDLVGIDLYERTRLAEEGITNVQALAHHDLVALTLSTRIPFERVVNWVDQAVLYEHVGADDRLRLRTVGVTTATALLEVHEADPAALAAALPGLQVGLVVHALRSADWVPMLLAWRRHRPTDDPPVLVYPGGTPTCRASADAARQADVYPDDLASSVPALTAPLPRGGQDL